MLNIESGMTEEIAMKKSRCSVLFAVGLLAVAGLFGCSQETPTEKTKAAAASGNEVTQAAGQSGGKYIREVGGSDSRQDQGIDAVEHMAAQARMGVKRFQHCLN